jgi:glucoamylase
LMVDTLKVIDHTLKYDTPFGPCWRRYNHDGYGQRKDGGPYLTWGQGRAWPLLGGERAHYELAAGHDVKPFIKSYEDFASVGGMMPEQVWDHKDLPSEGMYEGRSAGSAQPLVWAHAEYIKLLRSVVDGKIFDTVSAVAERYAVAEGARTFRSNIDIFQVQRPIAQMKAGVTLRIVNQHRFDVKYTLDNWHTTHEANSRVVGYPGSFVDIETPDHEEGGSGKELTFTIHWPATDEISDHWLGHNVTVQLMHPDHDAQRPLESKPAS